MKFHVGLSADKDLDALDGIEARAARLFLMHPATRDLRLDAASPRDFRPAHRAGLLWVARDDTGAPLGFALAEAHGGEWHLEEMDVDPAHGRQGIGSALVRALCAAAKAQGAARVTLTTFRDVPWNAPFYERLGFAAIPCEALSPTLKARMADEDARGLPMPLRIAMAWPAPSPI